jgi:hypothetical protein
MDLWSLSIPIHEKLSRAIGACAVSTFVSQIHFHFQHLEIVRRIRLGLSAHLLPRPLFEAIEFLVDVHCDNSIRIIDFKGRMRSGDVEDRMLRGDCDKITADKKQYAGDLGYARLVERALRQGVIEQSGN